MKLLIGVPTLDYIHVEFVKCLTALLERLREDGITFDLDIESGTLVYTARERIANKAINEDYSHVLWLDSDMVFTPDLLDDLMFSDKPFVTGNITPGARVTPAAYLRPSRSGTWSGSRLIRRRRSRSRAAVSAAC